jgi:Tfp pilus assembly protein PilF
MNNLATLYYAMGNFKLALPLYEKALHAREVTLGENHPRTLTSMTNLGSCLVRMKSFAKAETILLKASKHTIKVLGQRHASSTGITQWLVRLYKQWGKSEEAAKWKAKLPNK